MTSLIFASPKPRVLRALEGHLSETAIVRLLVNQAAASGTFQAAVQAARSFIPPSFTYQGTTFTVAEYKGIVLVTATLKGLEASLPRAFTIGMISLIQVEITGPPEDASHVEPGWYHDSAQAHLSMYVDPQGVLTGVPYLSCTCTGGGLTGFELAKAFYRAVLSGARVPTTPFHE